MKLAGREEELAAIRRALSGPGSRHGVLIVGNAGVGKTRLAREALSHAAAAGHRTNWFVATESAREIPLGAFTGSITDNMCDPLPNVRRVIDSFVTQQRQGRVVIGVDDAHLLDGLSAHVVHQLAQTQGVRLVVTARTGGSEPDAVTALWKDNLLQRIGTEHARKKEFDEARKCLQASFVLGYHLYQQRLSRMQLSAGLGLMAQSAIVLKQIENVQGNKEAADRYDKFVADYQQYYKERIEPLERVITSIDPKVLARHVGDVFVLAEKSSERVWRVEAVLKLGMYKYYTNTPGDRRAARRMVRSLLNDPDPAIQTAALAANELTREQYRTIGSR